MAIHSDLTLLDGKLPHGEVHVWHCDLERLQGAEKPLLELLDAAERERAGRFKFAAPYHQFVVSRGLLRIAMGQYLAIPAHDVVFETTAQGKPEVPGRPLFFNLSHTEGAAAIAITRAGRVGIDVERVRNNVKPLELAERFFSAPEAEWLKGQAVEQQLGSFFACWTAKEAYIKAHGGGLAMGLSGFGVIPRGDAGELRLQVYGRPAEAEPWSMWQLHLEPDLRSALAVEGKNLTVRIGKITEVPQG